MRVFIVVLFLLPAIAGHSQGSSCNCADNLNEVVKKVTENYAGYPAKVNKNTTPAYNQLVQTLQQQATATDSPKACYYLLRRYIRFFKDKHMTMAYTNSRDIDSAVLPIAEAAYKRQLAKKRITPLEGIWTNPDSSIRIAIVKATNDTYQAVKLASATDNFPIGFVYFTLLPQGRHYIVQKYNRFVSTDFPAMQTGNLLRIWNQELWGKVYPQQTTKKEQAELTTWKAGNNGLAFRKLNDSTTYLKVPSFYNNDSKVERLVAAADSAIRATPYLVVDLTGNGGGNTGWVNFIPYFMTKPVVQPTPFVRVTPDNVKQNLADLEPFVKSPIPAGYQKYFPDSVLAQYKKAYEELPSTKAAFYPLPSVVFPLDSITRYPKKIALMVDDFCGSSAEYFLYLSRQSSKTTTYGTHTIGMMDYVGNSIPTPLPCKSFVLTIPHTRSGWTATHPIDQTGFMPDVPLRLPQEQWIDFIIRDLPKR